MKTAQQIIETESPENRQAQFEIDKSRKNPDNGYYIYKVHVLEDNSVVYSVGAQTSQEACELFLQKHKPTESKKVKVCVRNNYGAEVIFTVTPEPSVNYRLTMED